MLNRELRRMKGSVKGVSPRKMTFWLLKLWHGIAELVCAAEFAED